MPADFARRLGTIKSHLKWVRHALDSTQKRNRATLPHELLDILLREQEYSFEHVITRDESWFFLHYPNESAWAESQDELPVRVMHTITTKKCLISVLCSVNWIHSLLISRQGSRTTQQSFCNVVVPSLVENICSHSRRRSLKGFDVHLNNSRQSSDSLQVTKARRMTRPAYSPYLSPSDFFLFGFLKHQIQGIHFPDLETLKNTICRIFGKSDRKVLISAFLDWIEWLEWVIENDGEYHNRQRKNESKMLASERETAIVQTF
jgi:hypothetical protein